MNTQRTILPSASRTSPAGTIVDIDNTEDYRSAIVVMDVTADPETGVVAVVIQGKDILSGEYYDILISAAIVSVGTTILHVGDGTADLDDFARGTRLPRVWRIDAVHADTDSITYSIAADLSTGPARA